MNQDILNQLKDIHMPAEPSYWPPALGYYVLLIILFLLACLIYVLIKKLAPKYKIKKELNNILDDIIKNYIQDNNKNLLQNNLAELIRRINIKYKISPVGDLNIIAKKLWRDDQETCEFLLLLEHDRFKKATDIDAERLICLAKKKFKKCTL